MLNTAATTRRPGAQAARTTGVSALSLGWWWYRYTTEGANVS